MTQSLSVLSTQQISSDQQVSAYSSSQESAGASQVPSGRDSLGDKNDETDASGSGPDSIYEKIVKLQEDKSKMEESLKPRANN